MANYASLKTAIESVIKTNGNKEITGQILQNAIIALIESLGAEFQFAGVATPGSTGTNPGTPDYKVMYIAGVGTYPNFGGTEVEKGHIGVFAYNGSWNNVVVETGAYFEFQEYPSGDAIEFTFYDSDNTEGKTIKINKTVSGINNAPDEAISQWWAAQIQRKIQDVQGFTDNFTSLSTAEQSLGLFGIIKTGKVIDSITGVNKLIFIDDESNEYTVNTTDLPYVAPADFVSVKLQSGTASNVSINVRGDNDVLISHININEIANHPAAYTSAALALGDVPTLYRRKGMKVVYYDDTLSLWVEMLNVDDAGANWWTDVTNNWVIEGPIETELTTNTGGQQLRVGGTKRGNLDDVLNVNVWNNQATEYASRAAARAAVPANKRKLGAFITYLVSFGENITEWIIEEFIGTSTSNWETDGNWKLINNFKPSTALEFKRLSLGKQFENYFNAVLYGSQSRWRYVGDSNYQFRLYPIKSGDIVKLTAGNNGSSYALLTDIPTPIEDEISGASKVSMDSNEIVTLNITNDGYLYVLHLYNGIENSCEVEINGVDASTSWDDVLQKIKQISDYIGTKTISDLNRYGIRLLGQSDSVINLNNPIILSQNGDSVELFVETNELQSVNEKAYAFSNSGSNDSKYYAIALAKDYIGLRDMNANWLYRNDIITDGRIRVKIEYTNDVINLYVNGQLETTIATQSTIQIASIGNGGNGTYGYWNGVVYSLKVNGSELNILKSSTSDKITIVNYPDLPKGLLEYNKSADKFIFYDHLKDDLYLGFNISHVIDNTEIVYLNEWRLNGGALYQYNNGVMTEICKTIHSPENEFTIKFSGKADYTGGYHGDERIDVDSDSFVKFFADGVLLNLSKKFVIECADFHYLQRSSLHETTNDGTTVITGHPIVAYHYKDTECANNQIIVKNSVKMASQQTVEEAFGGLFCTHKDAATFAVYPFGEQTPELVGNSTYYNSNNPDNPEIAFWNPSHNLMVIISGVFEQGEDNSELTRLQIWDRSSDTKYYHRTGNNYSKTFAANAIIRNKQIVQFK